jgi:hypothetical protein
MVTLILPNQILEGHLHVTICLICETERRKHAANRARRGNVYGYESQRASELRNVLKYTLIDLSAPCGQSPNRSILREHAFSCACPHKRGSAIAAYVSSTLLAMSAATKYHQTSRKQTTTDGSLKLGHNIGQKSVILKLRVWDTLRDKIHVLVHVLPLEAFTRVSQADTQLLTMDHLPQAYS